MLSDVFVFYFHYSFFLIFIFISWRLITLQYCSVFCCTWISHGFTCVPHPGPPSHFPPLPSIWVFPVHQPWALVSCIQPGQAICFTLENIHVSMLFSQIIPPSPSPTVQKSVRYIYVSFSVLHIGLSLPSFKILYICSSILYWCLSFWLTSFCIMGSICLIRTDLTLRSGS